MERKVNVYSSFSKNYIINNARCEPKKNKEVPSFNTGDSEI